jgi:hypothetical protein
VIKTLQGKLEALKEDLASAGGEQNARANELQQQLQEMDASRNYTSNLPFPVMSRPSPLPP